MGIHQWLTCTSVIKSTILELIVSNNESEKKKYIFITHPFSFYLIGLPYMCNQSMTNDAMDVESTMATFKQLVEEYKYHQE